MAVLKRVMRVYSAVEEMRAADLMRARADVHEAQQAIADQSEAAQGARWEGLSSLITGDRVGQSGSEALHGAACVMRGRLEPVYQRRLEQSESTEEQYLASRMKRKQIERLLERAAAQSEVEEGRKMQAASDDRFLARRWMNEPAQMKRP